MRNEAVRRLDEALWDYETALILHREKRYNASAFYSHQAAEKAVRALLYYVNEAPWGHSVTVLLRRFFERIEENPDHELLMCARELDRHYIPSRYPNALPSGTPHEVYDEEVSKRVLEFSGKIVDYARSVILGEERR